MVKLEVFVSGFLVGAVAGNNIMQAYDNARKYFPDATSVNGYIGCPDMVWISPRFALRNRI
jgi:hypothetical protein